MKLPKLIIRNNIIDVPIFQGGMGIGISLSPLSGAVAREGGCGTISSAGLHFILSKELNRKINVFTAAKTEVLRARKISQDRGAIAMNIMVYIARDFEESVKGAIAGGADMIVCGAGLPLSLPDIVKKSDIAIIPIVSSLRALQIICKRWAKKGRRPDAVIVEGPLAGGHLGFKFEEIFSPKNKLENIFSPIKEWVIKNGDFPIIVAGGIYDNTDILRWIHHHGADAVQIGTRFLATEESGATTEYKNAIVSCLESDITIAHNIHNTPGSPSGMPFRTLKNAPMFHESSERKPLCNRGFVLQKDSEGMYVKCNTKDAPTKNFCICNGLLASCGCIQK